MNTDDIKELQWPAGLSLSMGASGPHVKRVQEWLALRGYDVGAADGEFGPKTRGQLSAFQASSGLPALGVADGATFARLSKPMADALDAPPPPAGASLGSTCVSLAVRYITAGARELDEANLGPWVRLFMRGHEGRSYPWCAGFVWHVVERAAAATRRQPPFRLSFGCKEMATSAAAKGRLVRGDDPGPAAGRIAPGCVFVIPNGDRSSWTHTGFVTAVRGDKVATCEGNTNVAGSREGTHVRSVERPIRKLDFLLLDGERV